MGYKTSFSTRQKKFQTSLRRRNNKVLIAGVQGCLRCPSQEQTTLRYLALMEISDDAKGGILVLTRYFLDFFRARGFKRVIDDFAKKANIDEKQPVDGLYMEYWGLWLERYKHIPYWTFFCRKKLEALKKLSLQVIS
ncbi:unnamed protein product [Lactuca saligna]|uniref:Uncharacterized protein n=1 Tax=Lactuca saligna TaxID=75948 RepID=A0AA35Y023_LACSI|nr:unnamed protein product [Lactuca saligna]